MKWVCITGGAQRIGAYLNERLATAGYNIVLHYNQSHSEARQLQHRIEAAGVRCRLFQADLSQPRSLAAPFLELLAEIGRLDLLINNASIFHAGDIQSSSLELIERNMAVHLSAPWCLLQALRKQQDAGQVINMLDANLVHRQTHKAAYAISKQALRHFTELAAIEYAPTFRLNAIAPGFVLPAADETSTIREDEANLLQRFVCLDDIYQGIDTLINNPSLTGQTLNIDAGSHLQCPPYMSKR